ncbi:MAG: hypothetical protein GQE15_04070, partial [Archangiaceae bacterium]|nr:hypothetical protein [Archangiaceae bacterium]
TAGGTSGGTAGGTSGGTAGGTSGGTAGGMSGGSAGGASGCNGFNGPVRITVDLKLFGVQGISVQSDAGALACDGGTCSGLMPRGAFSLEVVGLDAGVRMGRWLGACADAGFSSTCTLCPTAATATTRLRVWPDDNLIFIAETGVNLGALGGVDGGDAVCATQASAFGLPGTYRAWLGLPQEAAARLGAARGWRRLDGAPFADRAVDLADGGALWSPALVTTTGSGDLSARTGFVATGALSDGGRADCDGWLIPSTDEAGAGETDSTGPLWKSTTSTMNLPPCNQPGSLYCLGTDRSRPVVPDAPPDAGRLAFLSSPYAVNAGGVVAANSHCQREAADAGLSGTFSALLATNTRTLRQGLTGTWHRLDGVPFHLGSADTGSLPDYPVGTLSLTASSGYVTGRTLVFTGAPSGSMSIDSSSTFNCVNWTQMGGNAVVGNATTMNWWRAGMAGCSELARLYCLQQ